MKKEKSIVKIVGDFLLGCLATGFNAWTVTMLWAWFAVAVFGLPAISVQAVLGLEILVNAFVFNPYRASFNDKESSQASLELLAVSVIAFLAGYVIHLCM